MSRNVYLPVLGEIMNKNKKQNVIFHCKNTPPLLEDNIIWVLMLQSLYITPHKMEMVCDIRVGTIWSPVLPV